MLAIQPERKIVKLNDKVHVEIRELLPSELTVLDQLWNKIKDDVDSNIGYSFLLTSLGIVRYLTIEGKEEKTLEGLDFSKESISSNKEFFGKLMKRQAVPMKAWSKIVDEVNSLNEDKKEDLKN